MSAASNQHENADYLEWLSFSGKIRLCPDDRDEDDNPLRFMIRCTASPVFMADGLTSCAIDQSVSPLSTVTTDSPIFAGRTVSGSAEADNIDKPASSTSAASGINSKRSSFADDSVVLPEEAGLPNEAAGRPD